MPPGLLQQSKTKMQAWVMSNASGAKSASVGGHAHANDNESSPKKSHVYHGQPLLAQPASALEMSPPRSQQFQSRMPIVNHNANASRASAAAAARINPGSRAGTSRATQPMAHSREGSLNVSRNRSISSEPLQPAQRQPPFWEGSTVDGSVFDETASVADPRPGGQHRAPYVDSSFKIRNPPRQYANPRDSDAERLPFVIGDNGMIDFLNTPIKKSTSISETRVNTAFKRTDQGPETYSEDPQYMSASPPQNTLSHRGAKIPLRAAKRESYPERTSYPKVQRAPSSPPEDEYQPPHHNKGYTPREKKEYLAVPGHEPHRSTVFENIDTPVASHQDLPVSDVESIGEQTATPRAAPQSSQPVNRQLFSRDSKSNQARNTLRESSMPRPASDKRQSTAKKRHIELDYDDGALAAMDYAALKREAFDFDPAQAESQSAQHPPQGTLSDKLSHFKDKDQQSQAAFFTGMSLKEWDDSGDWFLEQFGDIMHRLRDARKEKRKLVEAFETEVAEREDAVRNKIHGIDQTLNELRNEGEGLMQNKELE